MSGTLWVVLVAGIGLLVALLLHLWQRGMAAMADSRPARAKGRPAASSPARVPASGGLKRRLALRFHGVSVKPGLNACTAIGELAGRRFLPHEAPAMPLPGCDQQKCECAYSHHADRRDEDNRRSGWGTYGGFTPAVPGGNRRGKSRERRSRA